MDAQRAPQIFSLAKETVKAAMAAHLAPPTPPPDDHQVIPPNQVLAEDPSGARSLQAMEAAQTLLALSRSAPAPGFTPLAAPARRVTHRMVLAAAFRAVSPPTDEDGDVQAGDQGDEDSGEEVEDGEIPATTIKTASGLSRASPCLSAGVSTPRAPTPEAITPLITPALPASVPSTTTTTTTITATTPGTPRRRAPAWSATEKAHCAASMRWVLSHYPSANTIERWRLISARLASEHGIQRGENAVKNFWNREGRALSGVDERVVKKPEKMRTALQGKESPGVVVGGRKSGRVGGEGAAAVGGAGGVVGLGIDLGGGAAAGASTSPGSDSGAAGFSWPAVAIQSQDGQQQGEGSASLRGQKRKRDDEDNDDDEDEDDDKEGL